MFIADFAWGGIWMDEWMNGMEENSPSICGFKIQSERMDVVCISKAIEWSSSYRDTSMKRNDDEQTAASIVE